MKSWQCTEQTKEWNERKRLAWRACGDTVVFHSGNAVQLKGCLGDLSGQKDNATPVEDRAIGGGGRRVSALCVPQHVWADGYPLEEKRSYRMRSLY